MLIAALYHDQRIARLILEGHIPGLLRTAASAADGKPRALAERMQMQPAVLPEDLTLERFDRSGARLDEPAQKLGKGLLADEADAGTVGFVVHREPGAPGSLAHLAFGQIAEREQHLSQCWVLDRVQKVGLIFEFIACLAQRRAVRGVEQARVVAGGEQRPAQPRRVTQAESELDVAIAQHIGVGGTAGAVLGQHGVEHLLPVFLGKADTVQDDAQIVGDRARILVVLCTGAIGILGVPIAHVEAVHLVAGIAQQQRRDGRIDPAGQSDDHARGTGSRHRSIVTKPAPRAAGARRAGSHRYSAAPGACAARCRARQVLRA